MRNRIKVIISFIWLLSWKMFPKLSTLIKFFLPSRIRSSLRNFMRSDPARSRYCEKCDNVLGFQNNFTKKPKPGNFPKYNLTNNKNINTGLLYSLLYLMEISPFRKSASLLNHKISRNLVPKCKRSAGYCKNPLINFVNQRHKREKILFILPSYWRGGTEIATLDLARGMIKKNMYEIWTLSTGNDFDEGIYKEYISAGVRAVHFPIKESDSFPYINAIVDLVSYIKPKICVIANSEKGYYALPKIKKNIPGIKIIDVLHSEAPLGGSKEFEKFIDVHVAVSNFIQKIFLKEYKPKKKVLIIYNGVDLKKYKNRNVKEIKKVLFLGRYSGEKRPLDFVKIAKHCKDSDIKFSMYGDGPEKKALIKYAKNNDINNIDINSFTLNVPGLISKYDALVLTSSTESFGLVLIEAMASGLIVFTTNVGIAKEIIKDGVNGFINPVGDTVGIAKKIIDLSSSSSIEISKIGKQANLTVLKRGLDFDNMVEGYNNLFDKILRKT